MQEIVGDRMLLKNLMAHLHQLHEKQINVNLLDDVEVMNVALMQEEVEVATAEVLKLVLHLAYA
jgi:hypothetical protein